MPPPCGLMTGDKPCPPGHVCWSDPWDITLEKMEVCQPVGDPALIVAPGTSQYRASYLFLVPTGYELNYVTVSAAESATISIDGTIGPFEFSPVGDTGFKAARVQVSPGPHFASGNTPFGLTIYGYDKDVSYGYPAGLNLDSSAP